MGGAVDGRPAPPCTELERCIPKARVVLARDAVHVTKERCSIVLGRQAAGDAVFVAGAALVSA